MADEAENGRADGGVFADKICRADIQSSVDIGITDTQLNAVLDDLAPDSVRGKHKLSTSLNMTCLKRLPAHSTSEPLGVGS